MLPVQFVTLYKTCKPKPKPDGVQSQFAPVTSGVPQGTVLGLLLFLLHINDLPSVVDPNTSVCLFADDALVYRVINTIQDQVTLQQPGHKRP